MKWLPLTLVALAACLAQELSDVEQRSLSEALAEAGSSPIEFVRALENHLNKHPKTPKRAELERALVKAAIESKDEKRIVEYGERVLAREQDDMQILDRVARALLANDDKAAAARALKYAQRYGELVAKMRLQAPPGRIGVASWQDDLDRGSGRSLSLEARATGNIGKLQDAAVLAKRSFDIYPNAEAAREAARWLLRLDKTGEAIARLADAFTISDSRNTDADRSRDRQRLGELYRKANDTEKGLGDLILASYDRTSALVAARQQRLAEADPNAKASKILDFTLSGMSGESLRLTTLKGKAVVFDFWATWCGPCRAQHPLYEQVKRKYHANPDVIFLSVSTDEDRGAVAPFIRENNWNKQVYFEDGLARSLDISSIPTTIVVNRQGEIVSRMNGFLPDRFVGMLSQRIDEALGQSPPSR